MIRLDPLTGRRYVLEYVELGTRVFDALAEENSRTPGAHAGFRSVRERAVDAVRNAASPAARCGVSNGRWLELSSRAAHEIDASLMAFNAGTGAGWVLPRNVGAKIRRWEAGSRAWQNDVMPAAGLQHACETIVGKYKRLRTSERPYPLEVCRRAHAFDERPSYRRLVELVVTIYVDAEER